jgi:hypothetical protein
VTAVAEAAVDAAAPCCQFLFVGLLHDAYVQDEVDKDKEMHAHLYSSNWWVSSTGMPLCPHVQLCAWVAEACTLFNIREPLMHLAWRTCCSMAWIKPQL